MSGAPERWRPVSIAPDRYMVSDRGRVRGPKGIRKTACGGPGYPLVKLCFADGVQRTYAVHRLVADAFIGPANGRHVNHIDGVKTNNHVANLEYVTLAENNRHAARIGINAHGESHGFALLNEAKVRVIRRFCDMGARHIDAAEVFGVSRENVGSVVRRETWTRVSHAVPIMDITR